MLNTFTSAFVVKVEYLSGSTANEGAMLISGMIPEMMSDTAEPRLLLDKLHGVLAGFLGDKVDKVFAEVKQLYGLEHTGLMELSNIKQLVSDVIGDYVLLAPAYLTAKLHSGSQFTNFVNLASLPATFFFEMITSFSVSIIASLPKSSSANNNISTGGDSSSFFYVMSHGPSFMPLIRPSWHNGLCDHGADMLFTFGMPLLANYLEEGFEVTAEEVNFSKAIVRYWANFVKHG